MKTNPVNLSSISTFNGVLLLKTVLLLFSSLLVSGCSLYASQGRKLLEQQAFELAASLTASNFEYCGTESGHTDWSSFQEDERVIVAMTPEGRMMVTPKLSSTHSCFFHFQTAAEMHEKTDAAIEVTLHLSPVECSTRFAFQPPCNLK